MEARALALVVRRVEARVVVPRDDDLGGELRLLGEPLRERGEVARAARVRKVARVDEHVARRQRERRGAVLAVQPVRVRDAHEPHAARPRRRVAVGRARVEQRSARVLGERLDDEARLREHLVRSEARPRRVGRLGRVAREPSAVGRVVEVGARQRRGSRRLSASYGRVVDVAACQRSRRRHLAREDGRVFGFAAQRSVSRHLPAYATA